MTTSKKTVIATYTMFSIEQMEAATKANAKQTAAKYLNSPMTKPEAILQEIRHRYESHLATGQKKNSLMDIGAALELTFIFEFIKEIYLQ